MSVPSITIDGMADSPIMLVPGNPVRMCEVFGGAAAYTTWTLEPSLASRVLAKRVINVTVSDGLGVTGRWRNLVVVQETSCADPLKRNVLISDIRHYWQFYSVRRAYNIPAGSGNVLFGQSTSNPLAVEVENIINVLSYRNYSIGPGPGFFPIIPNDMLMSVLQELIGFSNQEMMGEGNTVLVNAGLFQRKTYPRVQLGGDMGHIAVSRLLSLIGGCSLRQDLKSGNIIVKDNLMGMEIPVVQVDPQLVTPFKNAGKLTLLDLSKVRARQVFYGWVPQVEVRSDFDELNPPTQADKDLPKPFSENVCQVVDQSLLLTNTSGQDVDTTGNLISGSTYANYSQYITLQLWLDSIANLSDYPTVASALSTSILRQYIHGPWLEDMYAGQAQLRITKSPLWAQRINAVRRAYRHILRLNPTFVSQCVPGSIKPVRAAFEDPITRKRSPSPVFVDWMQVLSEVGYDSAQANVGVNYDSFPWVGDLAFAQPHPQTGEKSYYSSYTIAQLRTAPFELSEVGDGNLEGIFELQSALSYKGTNIHISPWRVTTLPNASLKSAEDALSGAASMTSARGSQVWENAILSQNSKITFIFTATPGGPNNTNQWYFTEVDLADAASRIGLSLPVCNGPSRQYDVKPTLDSARFAWDDSQAAYIYSLFSSSTTGIAGTSLVPVNLAALQDATQAFYASILSVSLDHYVGTCRRSYRPDMVPIGSIHTVWHGLADDGTINTWVNCEDHPMPLNVEALMKDSTRVLLYQEIS